MHQLFPQGPQQPLVCLTLHVAQGHVRARALRQLQSLQPQMGVPYPPPQQRRVLHEVLYEAVVAAPQYPAGIRLLHRPGGELLGVQHHPAAEAVDDRQRLPSEYAHHRCVTVRLGRRIAGGHIPPAEVRRVCHTVQVRQRLPPGDDPLQQVLLGVAVYHPQPRLPPADGQVAPCHIKAPAHAQQLVQLRRFQRKAPCAAIIARRFRGRLVSALFCLFHDAFCPPSAIFR